MTTAIIKLTKNKKAIIDQEDFEKVNQYKWCFDGRYAVRTQYIKKTRKGKRIYMHRLIFNSLKDMNIDHINGNKLDNRKNNLRFCNQQGNSANMDKHGKYKYKGITLCTDWNRKKKWGAQISIKRKNMHLGRYLTPEEAALAYNIAAIKYFGEFARLNKI